GGDHRFDEHLRVGQVRPRLLVVADAAELHVLVVVLLLQALEVGTGVLEDGVVLLVPVGLLQRHDGNAGGVVGQAGVLVVDAAVLLDVVFKVLNRLGDGGVVGADAVADHGGDDQRGTAGAGEFGRPAAVGGLGLFQVGDGLVGDGFHFLRVGA